MAIVFRTIWVIAYRELVRFVADRPRMFSSFSMPLIFLLIFGAGFGRLIGQMMPGVDYIQFMYPGILAMTVLMTSIMSGISIVWDREFGFLKEVLVSPLSRSGVLAGKAIGAAIIAMVQGAIMLVLAPIVNVPITLGKVLALLPLLLILSLSLSGLGLLIGARMRSQQGFQIVMQLVIFPMMFLSGIFFPVSGVATWLEVLSKLNPVTYGIDAIRQVFLGTEVAGVTVFGHTMGIVDSAIVVAMVGAVLLTAAIWVFNRQE
ncbi:MAG: ABC transporter permease [Dehalococcoidia bacterium]|nr:ABC transporter permease [Dehalococcoidia bacterium]